MKKTLKSSRANGGKMNVTLEAIEDFRRLTTTQRLRWLDEMRDFLSKTLPSHTQKIWLKKSG